MAHDMGEQQQQATTNKSNNNNQPAKQKNKQTNNNCNPKQIVAVLEDSPIASRCHCLNQWLWLALFVSFRKIVVENACFGNRPLSGETLAWPHISTFLNRNPRHSETLENCVAQLHGGLCGVSTNPSTTCLSILQVKR